MRPTIIVFLKEPVAGAVKTRLATRAGGVGFARAAQIHRLLAEATLARVEEGARQHLWHGMAAIDGPADGPFTRGLKSWGWPVVRQSRGDLGNRMAAAMRGAPVGPVMIIGVDAPGLRAGHLRNSCDALRRSDAVFGPAEDGGYWLIGLARRRGAPNMCNGMFNGVRWSTEHALQDTINSLPRRFRTEHIDRLTDIDEPADLSRLGPGVLRRSFAHEVA